MSSPLRTLLAQIVFDDLIEACHHHTKLPREELHDAFFEVVAAMLAQESRFADTFENEKALIGYLRKSAIRRVVSQLEKDARLAQEWLSWAPPASQTPEQQVLTVLEQQEFTTLLERVLARANASGKLLKESQELVALVLSAPERYILRRQSGKHRGTWVFHYIEIARALQWNKQRVYDRLERIRKIFFQELKAMQG